MNNQIIIAQQSQQTVSFYNVFNAISKSVTTMLSIILSTLAGYKSLVASPLEMLSKYYSNVLGEEVSTGRTAKLVLAQIAFLVMIFPVEASLAFRFFGVAFFALSLLLCRKH